MKSRGKSTEQMIVKVRSPNKCRVIQKKPKTKKKYKNGTQFFKASRHTEKEWEEVKVWQENDRK